MKSRSSCTEHQSNYIPQVGSCSCKMCIKHVTDKCMCGIKDSTNVNTLISLIQVGKHNCGTNPTVSRLACDSGWGLHTSAYIRGTNPSISRIAFDCGKAPLPACGALPSPSTFRSSKLLLRYTTMEHSLDASPYLTNHY